MPGKSRHGRGKYLPPSKGKKGRPSHPARLTRQPAVAQAPEPVSSPDVSPPSASMPTPVTKLATIRYPHILTELRTIGIVAGIMLIVLIVLALVLS